MREDFFIFPAPVCRAHGESRCAQCTQAAAAAALAKPWVPYRSQRCDLCDRAAVWQHPAGGWRCRLCPRPYNDGVI